MSKSKEWCNMSKNKEWYMSKNKVWYMSKSKEWYMSKNKEWYVSKSKEWYIDTCQRTKYDTCQRAKNDVTCQRANNDTCQRTKNVTCQRTRAGQEWQQQSNTGQSTWRHFGAWKDVSIYVLVNKNITKLWNYLDITSLLSHMVGYEFGQWPWGDYGVSDEFSHKVTLYLSLCPHFKVALNDQDEG